MRSVLLFGILFFLVTGSALAADRVILVRHAEKATGEDPGLTEKGTRRAAALAEVVADLEVSAILISPTRRTRETAAPTAERFDLTPREIGFEGGLAAHVQAVVDACRESEGVVVIVGHGDTIPALAGLLAGEELADLDDLEYDTLFLVLEGETSSLLRVRFGPEDGFSPAP
jgi:broad specificity phosphatase PhoE